MWCQVTQVVSYNAKTLAVLPPFVLRGAEALECKKFDVDPSLALRQSIDESVESYAVFVDGQLAGIWGYRVSSFMGGIAKPWLFATPVAERHAYRFGMAAKRAFEYLLGEYSTLEVVANRDHEKAVRLLMRNGFRALDYYEVNGMKFIFFRKTRKAVKEARN